MARHAAAASRACATCPMLPTLMSSSIASRMSGAAAARVAAAERQQGAALERERQPDRGTEASEQPDSVSHLPLSTRQVALALR